MASYTSSVEDPEKHFLGNLLDDDTSFSTASNRRDSPTVLNAVPAVSVINGVGPINIGGPTHAQSFWPEPPPPYSPAIQTPQCFGAYSHQKSGQIPISNLLQIGLKEPSEWDSMLSSGSYFSHLMQPQMNLPTYISQPQIHHHHHNLHHHTHTNNSIENHYYDVRNPPPDFLDGPLSSPNFKSLLNINPGEWCENSHDIQEPSAISKLHPSSPVMTHKMPFSYRDVAARNDTQAFSGRPTQQTRKVLSSADIDIHSGSTRNLDTFCHEPPTNIISQKSQRLRDQGFQKIIRKRKKAKGSLINTTALPTVDQNGKVDVPTKYDVLQKLNSPTFKNAAEIHSVKEILLKQKEPSRAIEVLRSRSNSIAQGDDEESGQRNKRGTENKKKSSVHKKKIVRKRGNKEWKNTAALYVVMAAGWLEYGLNWILNLVVDVCLQVYDVFFFSIGVVCYGMVQSIKKMVIAVMSMLMFLTVHIRYLDLRRVFGYGDVENKIWGLNDNIVLPLSGEEALDRLLNSQCNDAYGVLGLRADCSDEDIKRHYKKLAVLLHPDKNILEGAEEAYEMVGTAFAAVGTVEARKAYNLTTLHKNKLHKNILDLWDRVRQRVEEARNLMYCDCGNRHARIAVDIKQSEARYCRKCRTRHPAKSNDIWVETRLCGFVWMYFTCSDGVIYDITEWATCEVNYLKHMRSNSHTVQYRLVSPGTGLMKTDNSISLQNKEKLREFVDMADDFRTDWVRGHAQVSYLPLEPRNEDRSRRAANKRQKKWR